MNRIMIIVIVSVLTAFPVIAGDPKWDFIKTHPNVSSINSDGEVSFTPGTSKAQITQTLADMKSVSSWNLTIDDAKSTATSDDITALQNKIVALEARVSKLEAVK